MTAGVAEGKAELSEQRALLERSLEEQVGLAGRVAEASAAVAKGTSEIAEIREEQISLARHVAKPLTQVLSGVSSTRDHVDLDLRAELAALGREVHAALTETTSVLTAKAEAVSQRSAAETKGVQAESATLREEVAAIKLATEEGLARAAEGIEAADSRVRTTVVAQFGEATREMATFAERISERVDHATALSTEASTAVAALRDEFGNLSTSVDGAVAEARSVGESHVASLKQQHLSVAGKLSREVDGLSRSMTARLDELRLTVAEPSPAALATAGPEAEPDVWVWAEQTAVEVGPTLYFLPLIVL